MEKNFEEIWDKYHRKTPIRKFDSNQTMYGLVNSQMEEYSSYPATEFFGNQMTFKELQESVDIMAQAFKNAGIKEGDNVAILTVSTPIVEQSMLALSKIGATQSWIDLRSKGKDLIKYINNSNCKTVIVFEDVLPMVESIINETDINKVIVSSPKDYLSPIVKQLAKLKDQKEGKKIIIPNDQRFITFNDFMKTGRSGEPVIPAKFDKDKESVIVQSSGSTGKPKQIAHTEYNFNESLNHYARLDFPYYAGKTTMHNSVPPFIIYGLDNTIYVCLAFGMNCLLHPQVEDTSVYEDLGKFDIALAAPVHYRYIFKKMNELQKEIEELKNDTSLNGVKKYKAALKEQQRILKGLNRAKVLVSGGDKMSLEEHMEMQQAFDKVIVNGYGNNEGLGATIVSPMYANRPGTVGVPIDGVELKIINPETGDPVTGTEPGELFISSDFIFKKYVNNPEETAHNRVVDENGKPWIRTGDLGYIDQDGFVVITGRSRRLIKKDAFKISPDAIENVIASLPFVNSCVVVGVDDPDVVSVPMAFVVVNDGIDFDEVKNQIIDKCYEELPDYEVPSYFEQLDTLPYTPNDKIDFRYLEQVGNEKVKKRKNSTSIKK